MIQAAVGRAEQYKFLFRSENSSFSEFNGKYEPKDPYIIEKHKFEYGPEVRYIGGSYKEEKAPKEIYKEINPDNEPCDFTVSTPGFVYRFFNNKGNRSYTVINAVQTDF